MSTTEIARRDNPADQVTMPADRRPRWTPRPVEVFTAVLVVAVLARGWLSQETGSARVQAWVTVFVSIVLQASSFVVLGTVVSAGIAVLVPAGFFARALPRRPVLAVPVAGLAGAVLPGCECGSVPVAGALMRRGVTPAAALAFLLSAPAINPVVLVATSVAFLVVGPMVDLKLFAMQAGAFGRRFAVRFAPATFVVAVLAATLVGTLLW